MTDIAALVSNNLDIWTSAVERKSSAGRGGGKKISLYGVERLRGLILDLAVRGKLVPQDENEESGSALLKRVEAHKRKLTTTGVGKQGAPLAKPKSWPFQLPDNWAWTQLGYITNYGETEKANPGEATDDTWVLELEDVEKATSLLLEHVRYATRKFQSQKNRFRAGDVIYGKLRPYLDKVIIADEHGVCTTEMVPMRGYVDLEPAYLRLFLKAPYFLQLASSSTHGMNLPRLGTEKARAAPFALPPLAEQQRIVAKVDELMALCDALEEQSAVAMAAQQTLVETLLATLTNSANAADLANNWTRLEAHFDTLFTTEASIDALKQTILDLAVWGKLVPQDENDECAIEIVRRIGKRISKTPANSVAIWENLPKNWASVELMQVIGPIDSGWSPACLEFSVRSDTVWGVLKTTAVQFLEYQAEQNKELPERLQPRLDAEVRIGDILITRAGPTNRVGICCFVSDTRPKLMISDKIIRFRPASEEVLGEYIALALSAGPAAAQIEKAKSGMAASQVNISQTKLQSILIGLAPLAEQHRIVTKVNELMALCEALKTRISGAAETQKHLADTIIEQAAA